MGDAIMRDSCSADLIINQVCAVDSGGVARNASRAVQGVGRSGGRRRRTMVFCFFVRDLSASVLAIALRAKVMKFGIIRTPPRLRCVHGGLDDTTVHVSGADELESVHSVSAVTWHLWERCREVGVCRPVQTF